MIATPTLYMLDTNTVSYALRGMGQTGQHIRSRRPSELMVSAITAAELYYGADKRKSARLTQSIDRFLAGITIQPFDADAARRYGWLLAYLEAKGQTIGEMDTMIAAHALQLGVYVVTTNKQHFERVPGLLIADWR